MDVKEFKAWFDGFCESIDGAPTPEQFAKIKAKIQGLEMGSKINYREPTPRATWRVTPQGPDMSQSEFGQAFAGTVQRAPTKVED